MSNDDSQNATDETALGRVTRQPHDAASDSVVALPDVADVADVDDVQRRRRRTAGVGLTLVAAVVVGAVVAWPSGSGSGKLVTATETQETTGPSSENAAAESVRFYGDRSDVIAAVDRTTHDGLRLRALVLDNSKTYLMPITNGVPEVCSDREVADVIAQLPMAYFGHSRQAIATLEPGSVFLTMDLLLMGDPTLQETLANGEIDPRTVVEPLPDAQPEPPEIDPVVGSVVIARGDSSLRSISVTYPDGRTDRSDATDGFAVVAVRNQPDRSAGVPDPRPSAVVVTFADGHVVDVDPNYASSQIIGTDGRPLQPPSAAAEAASECKPIIPTLPIAGRGVIDEPAAHTAVVTAVETAANGALPIDERISAFVDPDRGRRIVEEIGAANLAGTADSSASVQDLVFTSPTEAVIHFSVTFPTEVNGNVIPAGSLQSLFGKVVQRNGRWLVTSETICKLVSPVAPKACAGLNTAYYPPEAYAEK